MAERCCQAAAQSADSPKTRPGQATCYGLADGDFPDRLRPLQESVADIILFAIFFSKEFQKREEKTKSKANVNKGKGQQSLGSFLILADYFTFTAKLFEGLNA